MRGKTVSGSIPSSLLHPLADRLHRRLTVGCFPQQLPACVERDAELFLLQSRQKPAHQERMSEFRPQQDDATVRCFLPACQLFGAQRANIIVVAGLVRSAIRFPMCLKSAARRDALARLRIHFRPLKHAAGRCRVRPGSRVLRSESDQHQGNHREDRQAPIERQRETAIERHRPFFILELENRQRGKQQTRPGPRRRSGRPPAALRCSRCAPSERHSFPVLPRSVRRRP